MRASPWCLLLPAALAVQLPTPSPARASPYALRALRDMALVQEQLWELQAAVQPAAEQGYALSSASAQELSALSSTIDQGTGALTRSVETLSVAVQKSALISSEAVPSLPRPPAADAVAAAAKNDGDTGPASSDSQDTAQLPSAPISLKALTAQASRLHQTVEEERQLMLVLEEEESGAATRTREMFESIDINGDGDIQFDEFEAAAAALLNVNVVTEEKVQLELRSRFEEADRDRSGSLCYEEFVNLMSSLKGDAIGPLRSDLTGNLQELLSVSLQMIALTLSAELVGGMPSFGERVPGRAKELAVYVDRWCEIEEQAASLIASREVPAISSGPEAVQVAGARTSTSELPTEDAVTDADNASSSSSESVSKTGSSQGSSSMVSATSAVSEDVVHFQKIEHLLTEVGSLAGALSLPNATTAAEGIPRRAWRQLTFALSSFRGAMGFCARGVRILARDICEVAALFKGQLRGEAMQEKDWALVKRVILDVVSLVPYTIIMIIPLSPPGHVFAFSLMKKCFPAAVPSPFTAQRQDVYEIYSRIAYEARSASADSEQLAPTKLSATVSGAASGAGAIAGTTKKVALEAFKVATKGVGKLREWVRKDDARPQPN